MATNRAFLLLVNDRSLGSAGWVDLGQGEAGDGQERSGDGRLGG